MSSDPRTIFRDYCGNGKISRETKSQIMESCTPEMVIRSLHHSLFYEKQKKAVD